MKCEYQKSNVLKAVSLFNLLVCRVEPGRTRRSAGRQLVKRYISNWEGEEGVKEQDRDGTEQQAGLHRSAVKGQHPPLYGGKGVPVPARFCNLREHKHGRTEESGEQTKAEAEWMLSGVYEGEAVCVLLKSNTTLLVLIIICI